MEDQYLLSVERVGGFAGFGLPGSHLTSKGDVSTSDLSSADLRIIDALFQGDADVGTTVPDGFRYRITRKIGEDVQTVEAAEEKVPLALRNCVKDTIE